MKLAQTLHSEQDKSVNFVFDNWLEARFVRRTQDYFIIYLSSHDGCNKACRFCHLTQSGQTSFNETSLEDYLTQAKVVMDYYKSIKQTQGAAQRVNFNFMARGEPLANSVMLTQAKDLFSGLENLAKEEGLEAHMNISSIFPKELETVNLEQVFQDVTQNYGIYYSLYSVQADFRRRWLPKAMDYQLALKKLEQLQKTHGTKVAFHWAFIKDENDTEQALENLLEVLSHYEIKAKFNLVRYNPYSEKQGIESDETTLQTNFNKINVFLNNPQSRIVPRVGFDVKASCGMFVCQNELEEM